MDPKPVRFFRLKSIVLPLLMTVMGSPAGHSQMSFLEPDTAVWRFRGFVAHNFYWDGQYMLSSMDSVVEGKTYRKLFKMIAAGYIQSGIPPALGSWAPSPGNNSPLFHALLREEGPRVYYLIGGGPELLIYDFSQEVGDTIPTYGDQNFIVNEIENIELNNRTLKQLLIYGFHLIEGIGSTYFPFHLYWTPGQKVDLICYARNDTTYYQRFDICAYFPYPLSTATQPPGNGSIRDNIIQSVSPNPANDFIKVEVNLPGTYQIELVDISGLSCYTEETYIQSETFINTSGFKTGLYFLYLSNKNQPPSVRKIIISH